jgi:hypothetical protein
MLNLFAKCNELGVPNCSRALFHELFEDSLNVGLRHQWNKQAFQHGT